MSHDSAAKGTGNLVRRLISCILICLLYLNSSYLPSLAGIMPGNIHTAKSLLAQASAGTSSAPLSAYADFCTQFYQGCFGKPPSASQLYNMEVSLQAADPSGTATSAVGMFAAIQNGDAALLIWLTIMGAISYSNPNGDPNVASNFVSNAFNNLGIDPNSSPLNSFITEIVPGSLATAGAGAALSAAARCISE